MSKICSWGKLRQYLDFSALSTGIDNNGVYIVADRGCDLARSADESTYSISDVNDVFILQSQQLRINIFSIDG